MRQIRWAAVLLQKSLPPGTPMWRVTKADIVKLDKWFDQLSVNYGSRRVRNQIMLSLSELPHRQLRPLLRRNRPSRRSIRFKVRRTSCPLTRSRLFPRNHHRQT